MTNLAPLSTEHDYVKEINFDEVTVKYVEAKIPKQNI